jgi:hypothetical protein
MNMNEYESSRCSPTGTLSRGARPKRTSPAIVNAAERIAGARVANKRTLIAV